VRISNDLQDDAFISISDWIASEISLSISTKMDDVILNGDGTQAMGGATGFLTSFAANTAGVFTAAGGHTTLDAITANDLTNFMGTLPAFAVPGATFVCNQQFATSVLLRLQLAGGGNTFASIASPGSTVVPSFLGVPVSVSQKMPSLASASGKIGLLYGNFKLGLFVGTRKAMEIRKSSDRYFDTNQLGILANERVAVSAHGFVSPIDSTKPGPVIAFKVA
jgi:HK97 family phage major capsid protein